MNRDYDEALINSTTTGNLIEEDYDKFPLTYVTLMWLNSFVTVTGNIITIIAFLSNHHIRNKPANILILNLALADMKVGLVSLPFDNLWWQVGYWSLGEAACKFWLIVDYTASSQSMAAILMISIDRLWMVTHIHSYVRFQTRRKVLIACTATWIFWYLHFTCLILLWEPISGIRDIDYSEDCDLACDGYLAYSLYEVIAHFVVPILILVYLNIKVFLVIRKRAMTVKQGMGSDYADDGSTLARPAFTISQSVNVRRIHVAAISNSQPDQSGSSAANPGTIRRSIKKDRKAAVTLTILVGAFAMCWFPYNVVLIIDTVSHVSDNVLIFVDYLLWFNSALNPFLYVVTNSQFRSQLKRMFCGKHWRRE